MECSELVKFDTCKVDVGSLMVPGEANTVQRQKPSLEEEVFRLKMEWIMAKTDEEKRRVSKEIRNRLGLDANKK